MGVPEHCQGLLFLASAILFYLVYHYVHLLPSPHVFHAAVYSVDSQYSQEYPGIPHVSGDCDWSLIYLSLYIGQPVANKYYHFFHLLLLRRNLGCCGCGKSSVGYSPCSFFSFRVPLSFSNPSRHPSCMSGSLSGLRSFSFFYLLSSLMHGPLMRSPRHLWSFSSYWLYFCSSRHSCFLARRNALRSSCFELQLCNWSLKFSASGKFLVSFLITKTT